MVTILLVLGNDAALDALSLILVTEAQKNKAEASATISDFFAHYDSVLDFSKLLEIVEQVWLGRREG